MPLIFQAQITPEDLRDHPDRLFLFRDNELRQGRGGQAAVCRGHPNAVGIATKHSPQTTGAAYWSDASYDRHIAILERDLAPAFAHIRRGGTVACPSAGLGTGLSELPARAPRTFATLRQLIIDLKLIGEADWRETGPHILNKKHGNIPSGAHYCGRPSALGNPFVIGKDGTRADVIRKHDAWIETQPSLMALARELGGRDLVCWCAPLPCHCDNIRRIANPELYPRLGSKAQPRDPLSPQRIIRDVRPTTTRAAQRERERSDPGRLRHAATRGDHVDTGAAVGGAFTMSSRHEIPSKQPGHRVVVGWDNPLMTFFAQVERIQRMNDPHDPIVLWLGDTARQHLHAETMAPALAAYADLTPAILQQLHQDRAADLDRAPTSLQRASHNLFEKHASPSPANPEPAMSDIQTVQQPQPQPESARDYLLPDPQPSASARELLLHAQETVRIADRASEEYSSGEAELLRTQAANAIEAALKHPQVIETLRDVGVSTDAVRETFEQADYATIEPLLERALGKLDMTASASRQSPQQETPQTPGQQTTASLHTTPATETRSMPDATATTAPPPTDPQTTKDLVKDLLDRMRLVQANVALVDPTLGRTVQRLVEQGTDPERRSQPGFRTGLAYALQDLEKSPIGPIDVAPELRTELTRLAVTSPGLENERMQALLRTTPEIADRSVVRAIRVAARDIGQLVDQHTPDVESRIDVMENQFRLAPRQASPEPSSQPSQPRGPDAGAQGGSATTQARPARWSPDAASARLPPSLDPSSATQARQAQSDPPHIRVQERRGFAIDVVLGRMRPSESQSPEAPDPAYTPMGSRINSFEEMMLASRDESAFKRAEKSGRAALESLSAFANNQGAGIINRIREAAKHEPGGMAVVLSEMREGGRFADLRKQFNNALETERGFAATYNAAAAAVGGYSKDRSAVQDIIARRGDSEMLTARFERLDAKIGEAASETPGRREGESMLQEMAAKAAEALHRAIDAVKAAFGRGPSAQAAPSPSMSA